MRSRSGDGRRRAVRRPPRPVAGSSVPPGLRRASEYSWRLLAVGLAAFAVFTVLSRFLLITFAVFLALIITAVLRPAVELLARRLPRSLAVLIGLLGAVVVLAGLLTLVATTAAAEAGKLGHDFQSGLARIEQWLKGPPFRVNPSSLTNLRGRVGGYLSAHRSALITTALSGAGRAVEIATGAFLAIFCSVFFLHSGDRMWHWFEAQLPARARETWRRAALAAWRTFSGYTRGIVIVAATNAALVGIALFALRVPLALPLVLLEFFATFIPLVGSPVAMAVASIVALAARGPLTAAIVLLLIVLIGQIEGHLLHPLVMSWAVRLHPVAVALAVLGGSIAAGVTGAVVAVPVLSVAWAVISELRRAAPGGR